METMEARVAKLERQLEGWAAKLDALVAKADEAGAGVKNDYRRSIDELKAKHAAAQAKLDELKAAGGDTWDTFKDSVENAWNDLEIAFKNLRK